MNSFNPAATIVVVDDDETNLELLARRLGAHGYVVLTYSRGADALASLSLLDVDLIVLDVSMPEMSGYEVCDVLKGTERLRNVPVLFMSALTDTESKLEGFRRGGQDYITKPFEFDEVLARVSTHVQLYRLQKTLLDARLAAEHANAAKDRFLAMISHELRTPLNAIIGMADLLADQTFGPLNAKQQSYMGFVQESSNHLLQLVNDLLDLACLDFGAMELEVEQVDLVEVASNVLESMNSLFSAKSLSLATQFDVEHLPLRADRRKLQQVLFSLLSNAVDSTEAAGHISVRVEKGADGFARVGISDSGAAISEEDLSRIFLDFSSLEMRPNRPRRGRGLGLALSRRLVLLHGGDVGVASDNGSGCTFWFTLPCGDTAGAHGGAA